MGQTASAAAELVLAGTKGKGYALPHSRILLRQSHGGADDQAVDIEIQAKEMTRYRRLLERVIAEHTGEPLEKVSIFAARRDNTLLPIDTDTARELDGLPCYPRNSDATGAWRGSSAIVLA